MRDLVHNIAIRQCLTPGTYNASVEGQTIDRLGFESVTFVLNAGGFTDGLHAFAVEHSEDEIDWDPAAGDDVIGDFEAIGYGGPESPSVLLNISSSQKVGYIGDRQFVRVVSTVTGAAVGATYDVVAILGHAHQRPTT